MITFGFATQIVTVARVAVSIDAVPHGAQERPMAVRLWAALLTRDKIRPWIISPFSGQVTIQQRWAGICIGSAVVRHSGRRSDLGNRS